MSELEVDFISVDDQTAIDEAYKEEKPWNSKAISDLKNRFYVHHSRQQEDLCCYCQRDQHGEFKLVIDIEHILPKGKYDLNMFELWNLSVSCKRCNMQIKGQRTDFLVDPNFAKTRKQDPAAYFFVHPNFDERKHHLERQSVQLGSKRIVKYVVKPGSIKGQYTYDYFRLRELEIDSFDSAQSVSSEPSTSPTLDAFRTLVNELRG
ncbi:hypothetical protein [Paraburkholderia strydomiana]|jgi:uncharacterized protein (TIGR02646 family)|uniref:hypothetical protein n=1 Tax=Paraburkholderia strydomiana TaxID=1245417 RepID=UPI0038BB8220